MAVTFGVRAGTSFKTLVEYWQPGELELVDTSGYTARVQIRSASPVPNGRVLLDQDAFTPSDENPTPPEGTVLVLLEPGRWRMTLNASLTVRLPAVARFEVELVSDLDSTDVTLLMAGTFRVTPQAVVAQG